MKRILTANSRPNLFLLEKQNGRLKGCVQTYGSASLHYVLCCRQTATYFSIALLDRKTKANILKNSCVSSYIQKKKTPPKCSNQKPHSIMKAFNRPSILYIIMVLKSG